MPYPRTFRQFLYSDGYEIVQGRLKGEDGSLASAASSFIVSRMGSPNTYEPMPETKERLFLFFAQLADASDSQISEFANRYGYLYSPDHRQEIVIAMQEESRIIFAESVESWRYEARKIGLAVRLWKQSKELRPNQVDYNFLGQNIKQQINRTENFFNTSSEGGSGAVDAVGVEDYLEVVSLFLDGERLIDEPMADFEVYSDLDRARHFLSELIQIHLTGQVYPSMSFTPGQNPKVELVPTSLLACLWLKLALAVHAGKEFRVCPRCNESFLIEKGGHADRKYCNEPRCKEKAKRERKKLALAIEPL